MTNLTASSYMQTMFYDFMFGATIIINPLQILWLKFKGINSIYLAHIRILTLCFSFLVTAHSVCVHICALPHCCRMNNAMRQIFRKILFLCTQNTTSNNSNHIDPKFTFVCIPLRVCMCVNVTQITKERVKKIKFPRCLAVAHCNLHLNVWHACTSKSCAPRNPSTCASTHSRIKSKRCLIYVNNAVRILNIKQLYVYRISINAREHQKWHIKPQRMQCMCTNMNIMLRSQPTHN